MAQCGVIKAPSDEAVLGHATELLIGGPAYPRSIVLVRQRETSAVCRPFRHPARLQDGTTYQWSERFR